MRVREDDQGDPEPSAKGSDRPDEGRAIPSAAGLDAFRDELMAIADREIGRDLSAKVSASDLVQETFLAAGRDLSNFRGGTVAELQSWLRGILRHLVSNTRRHYRATGKRAVGREVGGGDEATALWASLPASATSPSGRAMRREREDALDAAMESLPPHYRDVIRWHHQERLTFEAIAGRLGISADAARKLWARALLRLRQALGPGHDPR